MEAGIGIIGPSLVATRPTWTADDNECGMASIKFEYLWIWDSHVYLKIIITWE